MCWDGISEKQLPTALTSQKSLLGFLPPSPHTHARTNVNFCSLRPTGKCESFGMGEATVLGVQVMTNVALEISPASDRLFALPRPPHPQQCQGRRAMGQLVRMSREGKESIASHDRRSCRAAVVGAGNATTATMRAVWRRSQRTQLGSTWVAVEEGQANRGMDAL
jgi:hypothetical protein